MKNAKIKAEHKAWQVYKKWQKQSGSKIRPGQEIKTLGEFKLIYNEANRRIATIKYEVTHQAPAKTLRAFRKAYREALPGQKLPKNFSQMSTREMADVLHDDIAEYKRKLKEQNPEISSRQLTLAVSAYFFGS